MNYIRAVWVTNWINPRFQVNHIKYFFQSNSDISRHDSVYISLLLIYLMIANKKTPSKPDGIGIFAFISQRVYLFFFL